MTFRTTAAPQGNMEKRGRLQRHTENHQQRTQELHPTLDPFHTQSRSYNKCKKEDYRRVFPGLERL